MTEHGTFRTKWCLVFGKKISSVRKWGFHEIVQVMLSDGKWYNYDWAKETED
jgi:hypothetical protein